MLASTRRIASSRRRIAGSRRQIVSCSRSGCVHRTTAVSLSQISISDNARYRSSSGARAIRRSVQVASSREGPNPYPRVPVRGRRSTMFRRFSVICRRPSSISDRRGVSCSDPECGSGRRRVDLESPARRLAPRVCVSTDILANLLHECRMSDRELAVFHSIPSVSRRGPATRRLVCVSFTR